MEWILGVVHWVQGILIPGGAFAAVLVFVDELILKIWPSPTQSSLAYRIKEIIDLILKLLPSTKE